MTTIEFSLIPDAETDYQTARLLMDDFKRETRIDVTLKRMEWEDAWPQLISIATQGQGVDVSHVGSTWVSSLMNMNSLRPMPSHLVNKVGSEQAFVHSTWSSVISEDDRAPYGIPLSAYVYIVAYRKDLLEKANLNTVTAFATPANMEESVRCLANLTATPHP